jgi:site-specific DNA-methyltransferase (cytosine-N4-specific)
MKSEQTKSDRLSTAEVARMAGVHKDTLLRWLKAGHVPEPGRDRHGWRHFTESEANAVIDFANASGEVINDQQTSFLAKKQTPYLGKLTTIDWDFIGAKTSYLTHGLHPYPAKFIPQIPNALIQELSGVGDMVGDIFCGSGTTLVEAITLKRHAVGIDANPLACMISRAKTSVISEADASDLLAVVQRARSLSDLIISSEEGSLFPKEQFCSKQWRPQFEKLDFWFDAHVIEELAEVLSWCRDVQSLSARALALTAFSAIVVAVSKQDSDTRYVRREKGIAPGEILRRFARSLEQATRAAVEYSELIEPRFMCQVVEGNLLTPPDIPQLDLMVCSPPYPNAYSYHLYHMTRMIWLGMDQPLFKKQEIGSHRKYSSNSKNGATVETFKAEFSSILAWLSSQLKAGGYACFVVGDSTLKGQRINNADLISDVGQAVGFQEVMRIDRTMQSSKKSFNPAIGKIKTENILILQNAQ